MFLFGLKMLWEAWKMKPDEAEEIQQEVQNELVRRGSIASGQLSTAGPEEAESGSGSESADRENQLLEGGEQMQMGAEQNSQDQLEAKVIKKKKKVQIQEKSLFGKTCYKVK